MDKWAEELFDKLIEDQKKATEVLISNAKTCFVDIQVSLEDRWNLYVRVHKLLPLQSHIYHPKCLGSFDYTDYINFERREVVYFPDLCEYLQDLGEECNIDFIALKEEILASGLAGFGYDW